MIVRFEPWGGWVKLETTPAIVALDREGVRALGLDGGAEWAGPEGASSPTTRPLEVHLAVTSRCGAGCEGCYLDARPDGAEPSRADLVRALDAMHDAGVFTVAFGGGEPTTREDLADLAADARARGLSPVVTTSGLGLNDARIERLRAFDQVNVSYDGDAATYASVRGFDGAGAAERAIARLSAAGARVGVNVVLTRQSFPRLAHTVARAASFGASEAQLLRYKPAGRAASLDYLARRLSPEQASRLGPVLRDLAASHGATLRIRIDCALVPFLSADPDLRARPEDLERFGVFGCEAAQALAAVTVEGRVAPCSFAPPTSLTLEDLGAPSRHHPDLAPWHDRGASPRGPCASCPLRAVCKGGCAVVASHLGGGLGPDPECPRVLADRAGASPDRGP
jgi:radical SAM protein with 4Fe4S-binding SPASM domain